MSEKAVDFVIEGAVDENTDEPVQLIFTVDYISTEFIYLNVDGRSVAIPLKAAEGLTGFLYRELMLYFGPMA